jgi:hypothetical protein
MPDATRQWTCCGDNRSGAAGTPSPPTRATTPGRSSPTSRALNITPHVAENTNHRASAIDAHTTRHPGHTVSPRTRKRIEEPFGWIKTIAGSRKRWLRRKRNRAWSLMTGAVYNLLRSAALDAQTA